MNARQVIALLRREGWQEKSQRGSHYHVEHPIKKGKITIPRHGKREIPPGTLNSILKQAGLK